MIIDTIDALILFSPTDVPDASPPVEEGDRADKPLAYNNSWAPENFKSSYSNTLDKHNLLALAVFA